jgi:secreted PhoX family phosphatase
VTRDERHGYVFEVPATEEGLVDPVPIRSMGRFEHEACAVHAPSGIVYMTEDRYYSLFYRYIPDLPGKLHEGGKLQALAIDGRPSVQTHNWSGKPEIEVGKSYPVTWIDLSDVNPDENDLRLRGARQGAATFARGEGLCAAADAFAFTCTIGGRKRLGQVFTYVPGPFEGQAGESKQPGQLTLVAESSPDSLLHNGDNLTMAPWGDLIICEDTGDNCGIVGLRPDGSQYMLANNAYTDSELAGVCFSPDGKTMFVNIQYPGTTVAITGPWPT